MSTQKRCDVSKLSLGDVLSVTRYYRVDYITPHSVTVTDLELDKPDKKVQLTISPAVVERECYSHNQYTETKPVTITELTRRLEHVGDTVFSCKFRKKVSPTQVHEKLTRAYTQDNAILTSAPKRRKLSRTLLEGEERTLVGSLATKETGLGRSKVFDLKLPFGQNERQVDHRTLEELIHKNVRYVRK